MSGESLTAGQLVERMDLDVNRNKCVVALEGECADCLHKTSLAGHLAVIVSDTLKK